MFAFCALLKLFFGGYDKAKKAIESTKYVFENVPVVGAPAATKGKTTKIDPNGSFMSAGGSTITIQEATKISANETKIKEYDLKIDDPSQVAAFVLLHELGHRTKKLPDDGGEALSDTIFQNNYAIWKACFSEYKPTP